MLNSLSENIFEGIIESVDYSTMTCTVNPINANLSSPISDVLIPAEAHNGGTGMFSGIAKGTRVVCSYTSGRSVNVTVIVRVLPNRALLPSNFDYGLAKPYDLISGISSYPDLEENDLILKGPGTSIEFRNSGDLDLTTISGGGIYMRRNVDRTTTTFVSEDLSIYSNSGRTISGPVRRMNGLTRKIYPIPDQSITPLFADLDYAKNATSIGFFPRSRPGRGGSGIFLRNPELSEHRTVINEFSTEFMFTGFDDEKSRLLGEKDVFSASDTYERNREPGNILHLAEHELIETVGGNLIDINGRILDINFNPLSYGDSNKVPVSDVKNSIEKARRISRRGVGYHFQLSTNIVSNDKSTRLKNFVYDIDKEGLVKVNIPASSNTGNIPFSSDANYLGAGDLVRVTELNPSTLEPIPVTLRDENGQVVLPPKNITHRMTGIRYINLDNQPPSVESQGKTEFRINPTKYHNMYATAERLISNLISNINIPERFLGDDNRVQGTATSKPFEVLKNNLSSYPRYMAVVGVEPGDPAVYHGGGGLDGGTSIAGKFFKDSDINPPYSNNFNLDQSSEEINVDYVTKGNDSYLRLDNGSLAAPVGGKSIHANLEGSVEASIGKDNWDGKSALLDTAGSIVAWIGKDKKNRSVVLQTDGDFLLNVGGSYEGTSPEDRRMNFGRFELRVNVTDKKFVATEFDSGGREGSGSENVGADSDYVISIGEHGLVIAGMKKDNSMIIRNDGPIMMESASGPITLKATEVRTVDVSGVIKVMNPPDRSF